MTRSSKQPAEGDDRVRPPLLSGLGELPDDTPLDAPAPPAAPDLFAPLRHSRLSLVVPVFNEVRNILDNLRLLIAEVEPYFSSFEILVISDGSTDGTNRLLASFEHPNVRIAIHPTNMGKGYVVREGFRAAKGDYILFIDGGMELHPKEIRVFLALLALYNADVVIGSKRHPQSRVEYPTLRRVLSWTYQMLVRRLFDLDVTDTQVGIKLMRREVAAAVLPDLQVDRYGFDLELLALAKHRGFGHMLEAPIRLDYFKFNQRTTIGELVHIFRVGLALLEDTWRLYSRIQRIKQRDQP